MKRTRRSKRIRLYLIGGLSLGALAGCSPGSGPQRISSECVYANNYYLPGAGYYHAPFGAWYPHPYNYLDPQTHLYYYGGQWGSAPFVSIINVSSPTAQIAQNVEAARTDIPRGGFGCTGGHGGYFHTYS